MATSPRSDLIVVRKVTKRRLKALKGYATYDQVVDALLETASPEVVRSRVNAKRTDSGVGRDGEPRFSPSRDPEEQQLIARLARERWARWEKEGRIRTVAPRAVEYWPTDAQREVEIVWPARRGFAP